MKKLHDLAINLGWILSTLILTFTVVQIGLRIAGIEYQAPRKDADENPLHTFQDIYRGWAGKPNGKRLWKKEGVHSEIKMNSAGFSWLWME